MRARKMLLDAELISAVLCFCSLLSHCRSSSYMLALVDLRDSYHDSIRALRSAQAAHSSVQAATSRELSLLSELRRLSAVMQNCREKQAPTAAAQSQQLAYFKVKKGEYERDAGDISSRLARAGFDAEKLSHAALVGLAEQIRTLDAQLEPLDAQLASFASLPPDLTLAHVRVAEARQQLAALEADFASQVRMMHDFDVQ